MRNKHDFSLILFLVAVTCIGGSSVYAAPSSDFPLDVVVTGPGFTDTVRFADHTDSLSEGNWVILSGGTDVTLPAITLSYSGVTDASYQRGGNTITVQTLNLNGRTVTYPLTTHPVYAPTDTIMYSYGGDADLVGNTVSVRVIPVDATDFRDAASDAFRGDTALMKSILGSAIIPPQSKTLDGGGDIATSSLGALSAGDYLLVIVKETTGNPYSLDVYSVTPIEVLDYASTVEHPSSVNAGSNLPVTVQLTAGAASRRYGAVMIKKTRYNANLVLTSDGTTEGTELTGRGAVLVQGTAEGFSIAGVGLDGLDKDELVSTLNEAYSGS
jgi:methanogen extracellular protein (TIGR04279 family)